MSSLGSNKKECLLNNGIGKYHDYNFYHHSGIKVGDKCNGQAEQERPPIDIKGLMP